MVQTGASIILTCNNLSQFRARSVRNPSYELVQARILIGPNGASFLGHLGGGGVTFRKENFPEERFCEGGGGAGVPKCLGKFQTSVLSTVLNIYRILGPT